MPTLYFLKVNIKIGNAKYLYPHKTPNQHFPVSLLSTIR
jgi:hypothetical protein